MARKDKDAIDAAARAFQRAKIAVIGANNPRDPGCWPGTKYIEAAVDAYLAHPYAEKVTTPPTFTGDFTLAMMTGPTMVSNSAILEAIDALRRYIEMVAQQSQSYRRTQLLTKLASNLYFDVADFQIRERFPTE
jgi:pyridoxal/pyridoxine/pyridoxamine kinase